MSETTSESKVDRSAVPEASASAVTGCMASAWGASAWRKYSSRETEYGTWVSPSTVDEPVPSSLVVTLVSSTYATRPSAVSGATASVTRASTAVASTSPRTPATCASSTSLPM